MVVDTSTNMVLSVIQRGFAEVVKVMLKASANTDKPTPHGYTALAVAAEVSVLQSNFKYC